MGHPGQIQAAKRRARGVGAAVLACLLGLLALPSLAATATSKYPTDVAARGFNGGLAGWSASSSFDGACAAPLLCPTVTNSFQPSGGADEGGFIRSAYSGVAGATAVAGRTTAIWESPAFTYSGVGGAVPTTVEFEMDRRASVDELLAVEGNSATYSARLIDLGSGGESIALIPPSTLAGAQTWRNAPRATIDPELLVRGREYRVSITTTYVTGTSALVSGSADYDNVVLSAILGKRNGGGGAGANGSDGRLDSRSLLAMLRAATPGSARLKAKRLFVRVKCPRKAKGTCRMVVQGLLSRRKPATARRTVKVRKGKAKLVKLRVKPKARAKVARRKRLLVRQKVRVGKVSATLYKKRKLIRR